MPELPEIEIFKNYFESHGLKKKVISVEVLDKVILEGSASAFQKKMKGQTFKSATRYGKYLLIQLDDEMLLIHFGMTGKLEFYKLEKEDPKYTRILFKLNDSQKLAILNKRKLGKVGFVKDLEDFVKEYDMGPDALAKDLKLKNFKELMEGRRGKIKSLLMNQKIIAGIGNKYSDEILFQVGIHPFTTADKLDENEIEAIYKEMISVLKTVIKAGEEGDLPKTYLNNVRKEGKECPKCGGEIIMKKSAGRSAYFCRKHQIEK